MSCLSNFIFPAPRTDQCRSLEGNPTPVQVPPGDTWRANPTVSYTKTVASGNDTMAAIKTDGTLWLWGRDLYGQLGRNSTATFISSPVQTISGGSNWASVDVGIGSGSTGMVAAIKTDGTLWTWGYNGQGQLGNNTSSNRSSPVQTISGGADWKQVSTGQQFTAAIKTGGTLWMWGTGQAGNFGDNCFIFRSSPVQTVSGGTNWRQVSAGRAVTAATKTDGTLWLWGTNNYGELGTNNRNAASSPVQTISGGNNWKEVTTPSFVTTAIKTDGTLWVWGGNIYGLLGLGSAACPAQSSPIQTISGGTNWKCVSSGSEFIGTAQITALKTDGTVWSWGSNLNNRNGSGICTESCLTACPSQVPIPGSVTQVDAGTNAGIALTSNGASFIWGRNCNGTWGTDAYVFINTTTPKDFDDVFVRKEFFTDGGLWAWGAGTCGQLGTNATFSQSSPVQTISRGLDWLQVASGPCFSGGIKSNGTLWMWGYGLTGILGNNDTFTSSSPVQTISGGNNWKSIATGARHVGAIKTDGTLWMWGRADDGRLGDNSFSNRLSPVQTIAGGGNWSQLSLGYSGTSAIKTDGTLWSWGSGTQGELGDNTTTSKSSPVQTIAGGQDWKLVSVGRSHRHAIKTNGTLWGWGRGAALGNGYVGVSSPVQTLVGGCDWKQVSASTNYFSVAIKTNGSLWSWGWNCCGALGRNISSNVFVSCPVQVGADLNWKCVSTNRAYGPRTVAAIKTDGTLWTWGAGFYGQLGNNNTTNQSSPIQTIAGGTDWRQLAVGGCNVLGIREGCW